MAAWTPPTPCACGAVDHNYAPCQCHNEIRDLTARFLIEVCNDANRTRALGDYQPCLGEAQIPQRMLLPCLGW